MKGHRLLAITLGAASIIAIASILVATGVFAVLSSKTSVMGDAGFLKRIAAEIKDESPAGIRIAEIDCLPESDVALSCPASFVVGTQTGHSVYHVWVDGRTGQYAVTGINFKGGSGKLIDNAESGQR